MITVTRKGYEPTTHENLYLAIGFVNYYFVSDKPDQVVIAGLTFVSKYDDETGLYTFNIKMSDFTGGKYRTWLTAKFFRCLNEVPLSNRLANFRHAKIAACFSGYPVWQEYADTMYIPK